MGDCMWRVNKERSVSILKGCMSHPVLKHKSEANRFVEEGREAGVLHWAMGTVEMG